MSRATDVIQGMLNEAKSRQRVAAVGVSAAERTLVNRRKKLCEISAEVQELEADLNALRRRPLQLVAAEG